MTALYFDENVSWLIARGLRNRGIDLLTTEEDGYRRRPDSVVMNRAFQLGRVLFSQDVDMVIEANQRIQNDEPLVGVVYARQGTPIAICIDHLEMIVHVLTTDELKYRVVHIPI